MVYSNVTDVFLEVPPPTSKLRPFTKKGGNTDEIQGIAVVAKEKYTFWKRSLRQKWQRAEKQSLDISYCIDWQYNSTFTSFLVV